MIYQIPPNASFENKTTSSVLPNNPIFHFEDIKKVLDNAKLRYPSGGNLVLVIRSVMLTKKKSIKKEKYYYACAATQHNNPNNNNNGRADILYHKVGDIVAFSCPKLIDTIGDGKQKFNPDHKDINIDIYK